MRPPTTQKLAPSGHQAPGPPTVLRTVATARPPVGFHRKLSISRPSPDCCPQDVRYATLLSELVYRAAECTEQGFADAKADVEAQLGVELGSIARHKSGGQRFLVAETDAALYVAFQGTKHATDWLANLHFFHAPFWHPRADRGSRRLRARRDALPAVDDHDDSNMVTDVSDDASHGSGSADGRSRAHVGFMRRAEQSVLSIRELHTAATAAGKRLVLTGHSLGGAVAALTTVQLLRQSAAPLVDDPQVRCISFATPAVANTSLLEEVTAAGWDRYITNIVLPEDPVVPFVNLLLKAPKTPTGSRTSSSASLAGSIRGWSSPADSPSAASSSSASDAWGPLGLLGDSLSLSAASSPTSSTSSMIGWDALADLQGLAPLQMAEANALAAWDLGRTLHVQQQQHMQMQLAGAGGMACSQADVMASVGEASGGSAELTSWLTAVRGAMLLQRQARAAARLRGALNDSSMQLGHGGASSDSLSSLADIPVGAWGRCDSSTGSSCSDLTPRSSFARFTTRLEATLQAAAGSGQRWWRSSRSGTSSNASSEDGGPAGSDEYAAPGRRWNGLRLPASKAGIALVTGALAAGLRCAAALASTPQLAVAATGGHAPAAGVLAAGGLLAALPGALTAPAVVAAAHIVGSLVIKAALPATHPLGQQLVMTSDGVSELDRPLRTYPRARADLADLGGLFPGHRMIAYRRRLVTLLSQQPGMPLSSNADTWQ